METSIYFVAPLAPLQVALLTPSRQIASSKSGADVVNSSEVSSWAMRSRLHFYAFVGLRESSPSSVFAITPPTTVTEAGNGLGEHVPLQKAGNSTFIFAFHRIYRRIRCSLPGKVSYRGAWRAPAPQATPRWPPCGVVRPRWRARSQPSWLSCRCSVGWTVDEPWTVDNSGFLGSFSDWLDFGVSICFYWGHVQSNQAMIEATKMGRY